MSYYTRSKATFKPAPAGTHQGVCVQAIELGVQDGYQGSEPKPQIYLAFELAGTARDDGERFTVGKRFTASFFEKSNLYEAIDALLGSVPDPEQFKPGDLLGHAALVSVRHKKKPDGSVSAVIDSVIGLPAGMERPEPQQELLVYEWGNPDLRAYNKLPNWLRNVVDQGKDSPVEETADDDVPFDDPLPT